MVTEKFNPEVISNNETGTVYSLSSGSGGFHASSEEVRVKRTEDGSYSIKFLTPSGSQPVAEDISSAEEAIGAARQFASKNVSVGMPGSGLIEVPDFDFDQIPSDS